MCIVEMSKIVFIIIIVIKLLFFMICCSMLNMCIINKVILYKFLFLNKFLYVLEIFVNWKSYYDIERM